MNLKDTLNKYIKSAGCTSKELSEYTGISQSALSRYRSGERYPAYDKLDVISEGIAYFAEKNGVPDISAGEALKEFRSVYEKKTEAGAQLAARINTMIKKLNINYRSLSDFMNIDQSYLYRIRNGSRGIKYPSKLVNDLCRYAELYRNSERDIRIISEFSGKETVCKQDIYSTLYDWLLPEEKSDELNNDTAQSFLSKMDAFDLNEFIRGFDFNASDDPLLSEKELPRVGNYYGVDQFRKAELDFIRILLMSERAETLFMVSNMPMSDMAEDIDFSKKWMMGLAMIMKKGMKIKVIHDLDRPFYEMMLGLISWLPLYMTGQVSPYFFKNTRNDIYRGLIYVSEAAVLTGECVSGFYENGRYCLTVTDEDVSYYRMRAENTLSKAEQLMEIYKSESAVNFSEYYKNDILKVGNRRNILCSLPLYTISEKLLEKIMSHNTLDEEEKNKIRDYVRRQKKDMKRLLENSGVTDEIPKLSPEMFEKYPVSLFLADIFCESKISYTYGEYMEHLDMTGKYAEKNKNYSIKEIPFFPFRNIQIYIYGSGKSVRISKCQSPPIHFIIRHPKLCGAIDSMTFPGWQ